MKISDKSCGMSSKILFRILLFFLYFCIPAQLRSEDLVSTPQRIVSLSPPATEQIFLLGAGDRIVGCTSFCTRPPEAETKEKIGSLLNINLEKLIYLSPDLVIASSITRPAIIAKLRDFGIKVIVQKSPKNFTELLAQFVKLGKFIGEKERATKIAESSAKKLESIKLLTSLLKEKPKVTFQIGAKPMYLSGNDSFVGDFITYAGGVNVLGKRSSGAYSREMIVTENPDVIFLTAMGFATEEEKKEWMRFDSISAVKNGRIFLFDSSKICSPNPAELPETVAKIAKILHPELAEEIEKELRK